MVAIWCGTAVRAYKLLSQLLRAVPTQYKLIKRYAPLSRRNDAWLMRRPTRCGMRAGKKAHKREKRTSRIIFRIHCFVPHNIAHGLMHTCSPRYLCQQLLTADLDPHPGSLAHAGPIRYPSTYPSTAAPDEGERRRRLPLLPCCISPSLHLHVPPIPNRATCGAAYTRRPRAAHAPSVFPSINSPPAGVLASRTGATLASRGELRKSAPIRSRLALRSSPRSWLVAARLAGSGSALSPTACSG